MTRINDEDHGKMRRLMILCMKKAVPKPLTEEEKNEYSDLTIEFNSKYPTWTKGFNFITGELLD